MTSNASYETLTSAVTVAEDFRDQVKGRNILITGVGPSGLGEATMLALAAQSPNLITVTGRSIAKVNESIAKAKAAYPDVNIKPLVLDLSSLASVRKAADEFLATPENLDILINNAGVMNIATRTLSVDGFEMQFATNHIGHFLFTNLIMPKILAAAAASPAKGAVRIINVSSDGHKANPIRFSDWNWEGLDIVPEEEKGDVESLKMVDTKDLSFKTYTPWAAYGQSKAANVLFTVELTRRLFEKHGVLSLTLHPGGIQTALQRHVPDELMHKWLVIYKDYVTWKNADQGSSTTLVAALDPKLNEWTEGTGYYLNNCQFDVPKEWAVDPEAAKKLWTLTEKIVGQQFDY
ncbi:hypothetical protein DRE_02634 [Drechslerella stenobrocha 248]|uniref:Uncharacterized protein n=1 Tax=Drechslerella stenobrocha 248 TaxID=1043628 RepID=W7IFW6_9PEZI|nr:hypothetical protein DRE_02634 [Drechslerella stenobrocha 248]